MLDRRLLLAAGLAAAGTALPLRRARVAQAAAELARLLDVAQAAAAPLATAAAR